MLLAGGGSASAATWSQQPVPNAPGAPYARLTGVSCTSTSDCIAVGSDALGAGGLAEHFNGTAWSVLPVPGSLAGQNAVSCSGPSSCMAVGDYTAALWNGSSWHPETLPSAGTSNPYLSGLSCSGSTCIAVGTTGSTNQALAERWDGQKWTILSTPSPSGKILRGVSCSAADACTAVGDGSVTGQFGEASVAERWNGTTWTLQPTPNLVPIDSPNINALSSVSCASAASCVAVGAALDQGGNNPVNQAFIARWDGASWTLQGGPSGLNEVQLFGVSCSLPTACTAFGGTGLNPSNDGPMLPLALANQGHGWTQVSTPDPTGGQGWTYPGAISCPAGDCLAVGTAGYEPDHPSTTLAFSVRYGGGPGVLLETPSPPSSGAGTTSLGAISCSSPSACTAVDTAGSVLERFNGQRWTVQPTPDASGVEFGGVWCRSATDCTAVGAAKFAATRIEHWNGGAWTVVPSPTPSGYSGVGLESVSCVSSSSCMAVGIAEYPNGGSGAAALAERWDGHSWTITPVPGPSGNGTWPVLQGVSCTSASDCIAVGGDEVSNKTIAYAWNGSRWGQLTTADSGGRLSGVSCASATYCVAVGAGLTELWNGSAWTARPGPPNGATSAVSCRSATRCTAVGYSRSNAATAAEWDGSSWTADHLLSPPGFSALTGVSCSTPTSCEAAGYYDNSAGSFPLAEVSTNPLPRFSLTVSKQGSGRGSVSSVPSGIDCGLACSARFDRGMKVTLTETPAAGSGFAGWGGACTGTASTCTVTIDAATAVSASWRLSAKPPLLTTAPASRVRARTARLNGTVDPRGSAVSSCEFDWGTTTQYTSSVPCSTGTGTGTGGGSGAAAVAAALSHLVPGTTYHFRLRAANAGGTGTGADQTFTTRARRGTFTFGNASVSPAVSSFQSDLERVNPYALGRPGILRSLSIYLQPTATLGTQDVQLLLYADSRGTAGALIAATRPFAFRSSDPAGWYTFRVHRRHLVAGHYWIGVITGGMARVAGWRYVNVGVRETRYTPFAGGPTNPFGATDHDRSVMSLYATLDPEGRASPAMMVRSTGLFNAIAPCARRCRKGGAPT